MANPVGEIRQRVQQQWPGATVHGRGRNWIRHQHPTEPGRFSLDVGIGSLHYVDGGQWQECVTDWRDSDDGAFSDRADRAAYRAYARAGMFRRIYPRRDAPGEYIEFGLPDYWRTTGGGSWRSLPGGVKHRSLERLSFDGSNIAVTLTSTPDTLKLDITLKNSTAPARYRFPVTLVGLTLNPQTWQLVSNATGEVVGSLPQPTMVDAERSSRAVAVIYAGGYIEYNADVSGLVYPIAIDPTVDAQVGASGDSGMWNEYGLGTGALQIGAESAPASLHAFARFASVTIADGATITNAHLDLRGRWSESGKTVSALVRAADAANPTAPTSNGDAEGRARTTASVAWYPTSMVENAWHSTGDITAVIQELVDTYSYASGAAMLLFVDDNGTAAIGYNRLAYYAYSEDAASAPTLHIEYTAGGPATVTGAAALAGTGALSGAGLLQVLGQAALAGLGALASGAHVIVPGGAALAGAGGLSGAGYCLIPAAAALAGVGTLAGLPVLIVPAAATLTGLGGLAALGEVISGAAGVVLGSATLTGTGGLQAGALMYVLASAPAAGQGTLTAQALVLVPGAATLAGLGALLANGFIVTLTATPGARVFVVPAEGRVYGVDADGRVYAVPAERRIMEV